MAKGHLDLLILNRALIIFYRTFILQHDFFLIIEGLLRYAVSSPRVPVTLQVHLRLREHVGIALQCTLSLQELCLEGSRVDFDQGLAFANELAFLVVNLGHEPRDFAGNRVGIDGSDGTNRFQINPNIAFLRGCDGYCDWAGRATPGGCRCSFAIIVLPEHQHQNYGQDQQHQCPNEQPSTRAYANYLQAATDAADQWRKQEVWFPSEFSCVSLSRLVIPGDIHIESIPLRATCRSI